jgi:hypothetical protein
VGFDLFQEIAYLLTKGQPSEFAELPTVELHIALLREWILKAAVDLVEIPPVPAAGNFIVCLTHDVDHVGVRNHKFDHTIFGFLYRATVGSLVQLLRGRLSVKQVATNCWAALSLPLVHLGLAKDFWYQFDEYLRLEKGVVSTFFLIPRKGDPGRQFQGRQAAKRAASYDVMELGDHLKRLLDAGCEVGVHGIDSWNDSGKGREELERIASLTGQLELGVRMHWLYFDETSPVALEKAGFNYDSTVGYNGTIGFRAGTTQAFRPLGADRLLELPLHVMDTALFYPTHRNLSPKQAKSAVSPIVEQAGRFGGSLTINWHDRSLAPERLWGDFYSALLEDLKSRGAWFSTASQAAGWFRKRRGARIDSVDATEDALRVSVRLEQPDDLLPGLRLRVHKRNPSLSRSAAGQSCRTFSDVAFNHTGEYSVPV